MTSVAISLAFPNDATNQILFPSSPFVLKINIGVAGGQISQFVSKHTILFRATNHLGRTVKEINAFALRVKYGSGASQSIKVALPRVPPEPNGSLHPGDSAMFQLLEFLDDRWAGPFYQTRHVSEEELGNLRFLCDRSGIIPLPTGAALALAIPELGAYGIQKPVQEHVVHIDVAVYAADTKPTYGRFSLRAGDPLALSLVDQGKRLSNEQD